MLSREPSESLTISGTKMATSDYRTMSPADVKINVMDRLNDLLQKADVKSSKACEQYEFNFGGEVKERRSFKADDLL